MIRIFEIQEGELTITEHCLLIKEIKTIIDKHKDPMPILKYVYLMTAPDSPYANLGEEERLEVVSDEVGGEFSLDDEDIEAALTKLKKLYATPTSRYYEAVRANLDNLSTYLMNSAISEGRDGNIDSIIRIQSTSGKTIENFKKLEKIREEELTTLRGSAEKGRY